MKWPDAAGRAHRRDQRQGPEGGQSSRQRATGGAAERAKLSAAGPLGEPHPGAADGNLVTWAFPWAQRVQNDIAAVLSARGTSARAAATAALRADQRQLDPRRAEVDTVLLGATRAVGSPDSPPSLPG